MNINMNMTSTFRTPLYTNVSNFYSHSHFWSLWRWYS